MSDQQPDTASSLFKNTNFSRNSSNPAGQTGDLSAESLFSSQNDLSRFHPLAAAQSGALDYLALEDGQLNTLEGTKGVLPSRGFGDELCYGTGSTYLSGLAAGGVWGLREGFARPIYNKATQPLAGQAAAALGVDGLPTATAQAQASVQGKPIRVSAPFRLRLNTVLNAMTSRGSFVGNNAGVLALLYNGINSSIDKYRGRHDIWGSMVAGAGTGAIWRSTAGLRPMLIASGLMTAGAAGWTTIKPYIT